MVRDCTERGRESRRNAQMADPDEFDPSCGHFTHCETAESHKRPWSLRCGDPIHEVEPSHPPFPLLDLTEG